jgi:hypothetical protein
MSKKPYEPTLQIKLFDLYNALVLGDMDTLNRLTKLAHDERQAFQLAVTKSPSTPAEWDEWERRRKNNG